MTQILALATPDCVLLVADRLLTWNGGPRDGSVFADEECKLIALCGFGGIGYTGLARLENRPTHEWIAVALARANSHRVADAARALPEPLAAATRGLPARLRGLTLLFAAWDWFGDPPVLRPHLAWITNQLDIDGRQLPVAAPSDRFVVLTRLLGPTEPFVWASVGHELPTKRAAILTRSIRRSLEHGVGPARLLKYLVEEVQRSSVDQQRVGDKILAMSVPRRSVDAWLSSGRDLLLAAPADLNSATFGYFNPDRKELLQYGPTKTCGEMAITDVQTSSDQETNKQYSQMRFLHLPTSRTTAVSSGARPSA